MTGDFTRDTFDASKPRTSVRHQQGRVLLDAEWNEQRDIDLHDSRTSRRHMIGPAAGPTDAFGFEVTPTGGGAGLQVGAGTFFVDGIRVVQPGVAPIPDLPDADGSYAVYLDAWERTVNAVQDPTMREVALGGPDTTVRTELCHRVHLLAAPDGPAPHCSDTFASWDALVAGSTGEVRVQVEPDAATSDPCLVPESAGYKGLENQLIRIEVHDGNLDPSAPGGIGAATPTFKWARNNASIVAAWAPQPDLVVSVDRLGPGGTEGFAAGGWLELTNDEREEVGEPGLMVRIESVQSGGLKLAPQGGLAAALVALHAAGEHPIARSWDSNGPVDLVEDTWIDLTDGVSSDGIQVRFEPGRSWRSGDHWLVTARTAILPGTVDRRIEWPIDPMGDPLPQAPAGPDHHVARLAIATRLGGVWSVTDCRRQFAPLADLISFVGRGGDGQHAPSGHWLAAPLVVGASHGLHPVAGRGVEFWVVEGGGELTASEPDPDGSPTGPTGSTVTVTTDAGGLATVWWRLGDGQDPESLGDAYSEDAAEMVVADLLDDGGNHTDLAVSFFARAVDPLILVAAGGDGQMGWPGETLEIAPRARVSAGRRPAPGAHVEFEVVTVMNDGTALTESQGGSIHATAGVVSTENWPGGSTAMRAVVATDADGVAQVQWRLGTETDLPVQRLYAYLLDDDGARTSSSTIFTAHMGIASEIRWDPCDRLAKQLPEGVGTPSVQDALDLLCELFVGASDAWLVAPGGGGGGGGGGQSPLNISTIVAASSFPDVVVQVPHEFDPPPVPVRSSLLELSMIATPRSARDQFSQRVILPGEVSTRRHNGTTRVTWSPASGLANALGPVLGTGRDSATAVVVTLRPAMFGRSSLFAEWSGAFRVRA